MVLLQKILIVLYLHRRNISVMCMSRFCHCLYFNLILVTQEVYSVHFDTVALLYFSICLIHFDGFSNIYLCSTAFANTGESFQNGMYIFLNCRKKITWICTQLLLTLPWNICTSNRTVLPYLFQKCFQSDKVSCGDRRQPCLTFLVSLMELVKV